MRKSQAWEDLPGRRNSRCKDRNERGTFEEEKQPGESVAKGLRQEVRRGRRRVSPSAWASVRTWDFTQRSGKQEVEGSGFKASVRAVEDPGRRVPPPLLSPGERRWVTAVEAGEGRPGDGPQASWLWACSPPHCPPWPVSLCPRGDRKKLRKELTFKFESIPNRSVD